MWPTNEQPSEQLSILVDDEGHRDDLVVRVTRIAEKTGCSIVSDVRGWLSKDFFSWHIRRYSTNRRRAPIYWQLGTPSGSYSVWIYVHSFSKDTVFRIQNEYIAPKLSYEDRRLSRMVDELREDVTPAQRKAVAKQETFVDELRTMLGEVGRVAPLWAPDLDDGVAINFAPLWRLVPQHKAWQKELKKVWNALRDGEYEWTHLALRLWPERVIPKCATDRSLAVAHGLEDEFWIQDDDGEWEPRETSLDFLDEIIRERSSPAVKDALKELCEAPSASSSARTHSRNGTAKRSAAGGRS